ncbi:MAG TPA: Error-prone repair protein ImuA [Flavisolibacter sp.]|nr:Error-prone repair protein ImuA [Flavisolibacter sp.]
MSNSKAAILARLQKEILPLQGYKPAGNEGMDMGLGLVRNAFPNKSFPLGAVHEFIAANAEDAAASGGFISGLVSHLMKTGGTAAWISASRTLFPYGLVQFGIEPDRMLFIDLPKEKELLWTIEEALKCSALSAVVAELPRLDFTASRRLQLAVEQSGVTAFLLRSNPKQLQTTACVTRWKITPMASEAVDDLPGIGFPRWKIELLKVRNGKPGSWQLMWIDGGFQPVRRTALIVEEKKIKTA